MSVMDWLRKHWWPITPLSQNATVGMSEGQELAESLTKLATKAAQRRQKRRSDGSPVKTRKRPP